MGNVYEYPVQIKWRGGREGSGHGKAHRSEHEAQLAVPEEFQGTGEGTNPEELLVLAVASCFSITYGIIAKAQKLPLYRVDTEAVGRVEAKGASFKFKEIVILPEIILEIEATDEDMVKAKQLCETADRHCLISNTVRESIEISIEPRVVRIL